MGLGQEHLIFIYDNHLLIQKLGRFKGKESKVIPNNMEKYMSISIGTESEYRDKKINTTKTKILHQLIFINSFQFMSTSLSQ